MMVRDILNKEKPCPLDGRYTMERYMVESHDVKVPQDSGSPTTENPLIKSKVHPYDLISKSDVGDMKEFFDEMSDRKLLSTNLQ